MEKKSYFTPTLKQYGSVEELTRTGCWDANNDGTGKAYNHAEDSQWAFAGYFGFGDCS